MQELIRVCSCGALGSLRLLMCVVQTFLFACTARGYARGARAGCGEVAWVWQMACFFLREKSNKDALYGIFWTLKVCREKREASVAVRCALDWIGL